ASPPPSHMFPLTLAVVIRLTLLRNQQAAGAQLGYGWAGLAARPPRRRSVDRRGASARTGSSPASATSAAAPPATCCCAIPIQANWRSTTSIATNHGRRLHRHIGLDWQFSGRRHFSGIAGETDLLLRNSKTGGLEVYDIDDNQLTGAIFLGAIG